MTTEKSENKKLVMSSEGCPHTARVETVQQIIIRCGAGLQVCHGVLIDLYP